MQERIIVDIVIQQRLEPRMILLFLNDSLKKLAVKNEENN
jgi:hypothetical protein